MHKLDDRYLLYIHPVKEAQEPMWDGYCEKLSVMMCESKIKTGPGGHEARYRGIHPCTAPGCEAASTNTDYIYTSPRTGESIQLNSLAMHYLVCHRDEIPVGEIRKLVNL